MASVGVLHRWPGPTVLPSHGLIARSLETDLLPYRSGAQPRIQKLTKETWFLMAERI